ncbi:hypothetical protein [Zhihengliuella flava]|uniref:Uncharacterized protein n=1 Tax=Zhihengliuella flava TaxID=1285193 RepID=A0A931GKW4_9MICC|nr:hypothetical protein [Zhihengliuella flava]MBG6083899.1 hypothetical protein [Zhihengliuella flava]
MSPGEETRRHARTRWVAAAVIGGSVLLIAVLIALVMTVLAPGGAGNGSAEAPSSAEISPITPSRSAPAASGPSSSASELPTPPELGTPAATEPRQAQWIDEQAGTIRVHTFGSSSCPAQFESVEVIAADEIMVHFSTDYGQTPCTMDYVATEHEVTVPSDAPGRPLLVSTNLRNSGALSTLSQ